MIFTVIIPHKNSVSLLKKLLYSIPDSDEIEIIVVDNSSCNITPKDVDVNRNYQLLYSSPERGAGGARNIGLENAHGEWIIFADADDYFSETAFDFFFSKASSKDDVIYTCAQGIYIDTGEPSDRADLYSSLIHNYLNNNCSEIDIRLGIAVPWCKMIRRDLIDLYHIRFDEIVAGNDIYFSTLVGYYAKSVLATEVITYIVTVSKGTLTKRNDYEAIKARLFSKLHCNQFLKKHGLSNKQHSILFAFVIGRNYKLSQLWEFVKLVVHFRQNPFVGCSRWFKTINIKNKDTKYFTK